VSWLLIPAADRLKARRVVARMDAMLGYPRTLAEGEIQRIGSASQTAPRPFTATQCTVLLHDNTGATVLWGAIAIKLDPVITALRERFVTIDAVRKRIREWIADQGWETRADLPGVAIAWTSVTPRDGAAGSADGTPIPEGSE
jgi:hypothetical protein